MKTFIRKILLISVPLLLYITLTFAYYLITKKRTLRRLKTYSNYNCLLMGDSQIQRLNTNFFPAGTFNAASSGEHLFFTYNKLLPIVSNNSSAVKKIVLGVNLHTFGPDYNRQLNLKYKEGVCNFKRYFYFVPVLQSNEFTGFLDWLIHLNYTFEKPDWGGFYESHNSKVDSSIISKSFYINFSQQNNEGEFCYSQKTYLLKIDSLCRLHGIDLVLISLPYHANYKKLISVKYVNFLSRTIKNIKFKRYYNFIADSIKEEIFSDACHLNKIGAELYSKKISLMLEK